MIKKMKSNIYILVGVFLWFGCSSNPNSSTIISKSDTVISKIDLLNTESKNSTTTISAEEIIVELPYTNSVIHFFSSPTTKDTFRITLNGESILEGGLTFEIINSKGDTLFSENYAAGDLIMYYKEQTSDTIELNNYITNTLDSFFDESNFQTPAIHPQESFNEMYSDESSWEEVQSDKKAIGFKYNIGGGSERIITYSTKRKKVICYYHSES